MERFLWICGAGALGTGARYLVNLWAAGRLGTAFPFGTLLVNVTGCFLIAFVMHVATSVSWFSPTLRIAITTGFLGGLTTYSSFNYETTQLFRSGALRSAAINFGVTLTLCMAAGLLGLFVARRIVGG